MPIPSYLMNNIYFPLKMQAKKCRYCSGTSSTEQYWVHGVRLLNHIFRLFPCFFGSLNPITNFCSVSCPSLLVHGTKPALFLAFVCLDRFAHFQEPSSDVPSTELDPSSPRSVTGSGNKARKGRMNWTRAKKMTGREERTKTMNSKWGGGGSCCSWTVFYYPCLNLDPCSSWISSHIFWL
jgi:hypothetical protein